MEFKLPFQRLQINHTGVPYLGVPASPHRMLVIRKMTGKAGFRHQVADLLDIGTPF